jgi:PncC family amidohydrolase
MLIHKCTHRGERKYTYRGTLESFDGSKAVVCAPWAFDALALSYSRFEPGDIFSETFYTDRWYNVFEIVDREGSHKGWYGNITRPSRVVSDEIEWDDLELDVWMHPNGDWLILDQEDFGALQTKISPLEYATAQGALPQLIDEMRERWRVYANEQIACKFISRDWTLGTAESCTGGLIGDVLTDHPGASAYFKGGVISYSNEIKQRMLGVREQTLIEHGAVSEACAIEMARGVRAALGVDVGISATGIAGPDGATETKPVGLVFVGLSSPLGDSVSRFVWDNDRVGNKQLSADEALKALMKM